MKPPTTKTEKEPVNQINPKTVTAACVLDFDPNEFAHYLADMDLTPEEQDEIIRMTANAMMAFVDMGFGITPLQTAFDSDSCEQEDNLFGKLSLSDDDLLYLSDPEHELFDDRAAKTFAAKEMIHE